MNFRFALLRIELEDVMHPRQQRSLFKAPLIAASAALILASGCSSNPKPANPAETAKTIDQRGAAVATGGNGMPDRPIQEPTTATRTLGKSSPAPGPAGGSQVPASTAPTNSLIPQVTPNASISSPGAGETIPTPIAKGVTTTPVSDVNETTTNTLPTTGKGTTTSTSVGTATGAPATTTTTTTTSTTKKRSRFSIFNRSGRKVTVEKDTTKK
ncbi:MAG TPA: hypothetical protein VHL58_07660 [Thermoanaerobaculia bacterium]|nr:hypothetical protein [Thermoanaerobaculia bacterium]